jgi:2-keto-3-deoxy-L-rhamnonate aldolase RhmA
MSAFRSRLNQGERLIGTFIKTPSPIVCEVLGLSPLDLVCLDAEHAPFDRASLDSCIAALRASRKPCLVRTPSSAAEHILGALDMGADGVIVPHVRGAEEAMAIVRSARYGRGGYVVPSRGYAGSSRAAGYGTVSIAQHLDASARNTVVVLQIEDAEALPHVAEIAAVAGVDALFIGRADLAVSQGERSLMAPSVITCCEGIVRDARRANLAVGLFVPDTAEIAKWTDLGASLFLLASDHNFLLNGAKQLFEAAHGNRHASC